MTDFDAFLRRAQEFPSSTSGIGLMAIQEEMFKRKELRKQKMKSFFGRLFGKKTN